MMTITEFNQLTPDEVGQMRNECGCRDGIQESCRICPEIFGCIRFVLGKQVILK